MNISSVIKNYNLNSLTLGVLGSHSALDLCLGAKKQGLKTIVVAQKGREKVYTSSYIKKGGTGCVDEVMVLSSFKDILKKDNQEKLRKKNVVFVPHRSFQAYLDFDYDAIENNFEVPVFGNRYLLKIEERGIKPNQYELLSEAGIKTPKLFKSYKEIDRPVIVKVLEKERGFERAFFLAASPQEFSKKSKELISKGVFTKKNLEKAAIEEFLPGVQVNLNYFHSPISKRLEFLGSDTRRQTNVEGLSRLNALFRLAETSSHLASSSAEPNSTTEAEKYAALKFEEAGHIAVTLLESMLLDVFEMGERFVKAAKKFSAPGVIGPFALQAFIVPGPPKKEFVVFDVSCRMPGSPGIKATPYSEYFWGKPISMGERVAMEIKEAQKKNNLSDIIT